MTSRDALKSASTSALLRRCLAIGRCVAGAAAPVSKRQGTEHGSIPTQDGGAILADLYGTGERGVVLAHGGRFNKESWVTQARALESAGFRVLALDFRGYGESR